MIEQLSKYVETIKDSDLAELINLLRTWTDFKDKGGSIGGDITIPVIGTIGTAIKGTQDNINTITPQVKSWVDFKTNGGTIGGDIRLSVGLVGATITSYGERLRTIESTQGTHGTDISNLKRDVNANTLSITNLTKILEGHTTGINQLGTRIATWETFKTSGGDLGGDIRLPQIGSVVNRIESNTQEINGIKDSIVGNKPIVINDSVPIGTVMFRNSGASLPSGWLLCNGALVLQADYPELYAVLGKTYGGDATRFSLPLMVDGTSLLLQGEKGTDYTLSRVIGQQGIIKAKSTASEQMDIALEWNNFKTNGGKVGTVSITPGVEGDTINTSKPFIILGGSGLSAIRIGNMTVEPVPKSAGGINLGSYESPFKDLVLSNIGSVQNAFADRLSVTYGTWNPVIYEGTNGNNPSSHNPAGSYWIKIGRVVIAHFSVEIPSGVIPEAWKGAAMLLKWLPFPMNRDNIVTPVVSYYEGLILPTDCIGVGLYRHATADSFWLSRLNKYNSYSGMEWGNHADRNSKLIMQGTITYYTS